MDSISNNILFTRETLGDLALTAGVLLGAGAFSAAKTDDLVSSLFLSGLSAAFTSIGSSLKGNQEAAAAFGAASGAIFASAKFIQNEYEQIVCDTILPGIEMISYVYQMSVYEQTISECLCLTPS